jgi:RNA polymerase sigma factor (sigma-70 family)
MQTSPFVPTPAVRPSSVGTLSRHLSGDTFGVGPGRSGGMVSGADAVGALNGDILAIARDADRAAFARLFAHFAPRLKAYLGRLGADGATADELIQEVMLLVWRRADTFDPSQANANTWVFAIARNKRIDGIRRERRPEIDPDDPALVPAHPDPADAMVAARQDGERVRAALAELPPEQAELVRQAYYEDKPHSQIAQESGLPLGTVKSRIRLALVRLRNSMKDG